VALRRHPRDDRPCLDVGHHAPLARDRHAVAHDDAIPHPDLARERHALADLRRAGDSDLAADDRMRADRHVVADLHEIVDLRSAADPGLGERRPVDAGIGPHVDVVLEHDDPDLGNAAMLPAVPHVAESVGAHHRAGEEPAARADAASRGDDRAHADPRIIADRGPLADEGVGAERDAIADDRAGFDDRPRPDHDVLPDPGLRGYPCGSRALGAGRLLGMEMRESGRDRDHRVRMDERRPPARVLERGDDQRAGAALARGPRVAGPRHEAQLVGARIGERRDPPKDEPAGAGELGACDPGDFLEGERPHVIEINAPRRVGAEASWRPASEARAWRSPASWRPAPTAERSPGC
jgi:hypothetical protein